MTHELTAAVCAAALMMGSPTLGWTLLVLVLPIIDFSVWLIAGPSPAPTATIHDCDCRNPEHRRHCDRHYLVAVVREGVAP